MFYLATEFLKLKIVCDAVSKRNAFAPRTRASTNNSSPQTGFLQLNVKTAGVQEGANSTSIRQSATRILISLMCALVQHTSGVITHLGGREEFASTKSGRDTSQHHLNQGNEKKHPAFCQIEHYLVTRLIIAHFVAAPDFLHRDIRFVFAGRKPIRRLSVLRNRT